MATTTGTGRDPLKSDGWIYDYGVASGVIVRAGTILEVFGGLVRSAVAGASVLAGVSEDFVNNSATNTALTTVTGGGLYTRVARKGIFRFNAAGTPLVTHVGQFALPTDNDTVGVTNAPGLSGGAAYLGKIVGFTTTGGNYYDVDLGSGVL